MIIIFAFVLSVRFLGMGRKIVLIGRGWFPEVQDTSGAVLGQNMLFDKNVKTTSGNHEILTGRTIVFRENNIHKKMRIKKSRMLMVRTAPHLLI